LSLDQHSSHQDENEPPADDYPAWLKRGLIDGDLPWSAALDVDLPAFLAQYTLHDSLWLGIWTSSIETVAVIRWDTFWHRDVLPYPSSLVANWPILLIQFELVYQVAILTTRAVDMLRDESIASAESQLVDAEQREALLTLSLELKKLPDDMRELYLDGELFHTILRGADYRNIHIYHKPRVRILCMNRAGDTVGVPWPKPPVRPIAPADGG